MINTIFYLVLFCFILYVVIRDFRSWRNKKKMPAGGLSEAQVKQVIEDMIYPALIEWEQARAATTPTPAPVAAVTPAPASPNGHEDAAYVAQFEAMFGDPPSKAPEPAAPVVEAVSSGPSQPTATVRERVLTLLKSGPKTSAEVVTAIGVKESACRANLYDLKKRGQVTQLPDKRYALVVTEAKA